MLDLTADLADLTAALVDQPSESTQEAELADAVWQALTSQAPHLEVIRSGNAVLARTMLNRPSRVIVAGHLDTVPINGNLPCHRTGSGDESILHGCGTVDMKSGDAVMLRLAATSIQPKHDMTFIFYDCEEIEASRNGLGRIGKELPEWLAADLAIVCEPSNAIVEAGCQGSIRVELRTSGQRAHTARAWMGVNAIHLMGDVLRRLESYQPRQVEIDGCVYREGLQAVRISGGVAGNVVPDDCVLTINHRFAPDRSPEQAFAHLQQTFPGAELTIVDCSPGALPRLGTPIVREFLTTADVPVVGKLGWTDVSRFAALGISAVNFGPGDPALAHTREENVPVKHINQCFVVLSRFVNS